MDADAHNWDTRELADKNDRLLTAKEIRLAGFSDARLFDQNFVHLLKAQLAKDLLHEQERVERIFEEADRLFAMSLCVGSAAQIDKVRDLWQALKKREGVK